jgi:hypothetical protein
MSLTSQALAIMILNTLSLNEPSSLLVQPYRGWPRYWAMLDTKLVWYVRWGTYCYPTHPIDLLGSARHMAGMLLFCTPSERKEASCMERVNLSPELE